MKRLIALICLIALSLLAPQNAKGQNLPEYLQISSRQEAIDWAMTNQIDKIDKSLTVCLTWVTKNDIINYQGWTEFSVKFTDFNSNSMIDLIVKDGIRIRDMIFERVYAGNTSIGSDIWMYVESTSHPVNSTSQGQFRYTKILGPLDAITEETLRVIPSEFVYQSVIIPVPGLERFEIQADKAPPSSYYVWTNGTNVKMDNIPETPYSYIWNNGIATSNRSIQRYRDDYMFKEMTRTNLIVLNEWCINNTNRTRYTIVANGVTNTYTQYGDMLKAKMLVTTNSLNILHSRGTDISIESSPDFKNWTGFGGVSSSPTNFTSFNIDTTTPSRFFRAKVW